HVRGKPRGRSSHEFAPLTPPSPAEAADGPPTSGGTKKNTRPPRRPKAADGPPTSGGTKKNPPPRRPKRPTVPHLWGDKEEDALLRPGLGLVCRGFPGVSSGKRLRRGHSRRQHRNGSTPAPAKATNRSRGPASRRPRPP